MLWRAVPACEADWVLVAGQLSTVLLELRADRGDAEVFPPPLSRGVALRAWGRLSASIRAARLRGVPAVALPGDSELWIVAVHSGDVDVLGAAARELGRSQLPHGDCAVAETLARAARAVDRTPVDLVAQMAGVHGVLDLSLGSSAEVLADSQAGLQCSGETDLAVASQQVAVRVYAMWRAGQHRAGEAA